MRLRDIHLLPESLTMLFEHFKRNKISSCLMPLIDDQALIQRLLDSQFLDFQFLSNICQLSFDIITAPVDEPEYYMFIFKKTEQDYGHHIMVEIWEDGSAYLILSLDINKYLPFVRGLMEDDLLKVSSLQEGDTHIAVHETDIMTMDEFKNFLSDNSMPGKIIFIEVD